jgi:hypothetical protein
MIQEHICGIAPHFLTTRWSWARGGGGRAHQAEGGQIRLESGPRPLLAEVMVEAHVYARRQPHGRHVGGEGQGKPRAQRQDVYEAAPRDKQVLPRHQEGGLPVVGRVRERRPELSPPGSRITWIIRINWITRIAGITNLITNEITRQRKPHAHLQELR